MVWIPLHADLAAHPKTRKLARRLSLDVPAVIGHLTLLWTWAMSYAPDGELTKHDAEDVALGAHWEGEPDAFQRALIDAGFLDAEDDRVRLHDWQEYGGKLLEKRRADAERKAAERASKSVQGTSGGHPEDGARRREQTDETQEKTTDGQSVGRPTDVAKCETCGEESWDCDSCAHRKREAQQEAQLPPELRDIKKALVTQGYTATDASYGVEAVRAAKAKGEKVGRPFNYAVASISKRAS